MEILGFRGKVWRRLDRGKDWEGCFEYLEAYVCMGGKLSNARFKISLCEETSEGVWTGVERMLYMLGDIYSFDTSSSTCKLRYEYLSTYQEKV